MYISGIGTAFGGQKIELTREFLRTKQHLEDEDRVVYYKASDDETPFTLAYAAAADALKSADITAQDLDAVIYANTLLKDYSTWSMSAAICNKLGIIETRFLDIYQGCNGMAAAVELSKDLLGANPSWNNILIATSSVLPEVLGDHETVDRGGIMSDAGSTIVLNRKGGMYKVLSTSLHFLSRINDFIKLPYGGTEELRKTDKVAKWNIVSIKDEFYSGSEPDYDESFNNPRKNNIFETLKLAGVDIKDVSYFITPNYCRFYNSKLCELFTHLPPENFSTDIGMNFSHMGASDIIVDLNAMKERIKSGEVVVLSQDGAGFSFGCIVVRKV